MRETARGVPSLLSKSSPSPNKTSPQLKKRGIPAPSGLLQRRGVSLAEDCVLWKLRPGGRPSSCGGLEASSSQSPPLAGLPPLSFLSWEEYARAKIRGSVEAAAERRGLAAAWEIFVEGMGSVGSESAGTKAYIYAVAGRNRGLTLGTCERMSIETGEWEWCPMLKVHNSLLPYPTLIDPTHYHCDPLPHTLVTVAESQHGPEVSNILT